jgi:SAM-dependent methyltransferase
MSTLSRRRSFLAKYIDIERNEGLEIGPLDSPMVLKAEGTIYYLDYLDHEQLVSRHANRRNVSKIVHPDYVISDQKISSEISRKFDYIIACHVIEHVPNLVQWLKDIQKLMSQGGVLFLAVPDKRYTFDFLRPLTSLAHILNDYYLSKNKANLEHIFEHIYLKREVTSKDIWQGEFEDKIRLGRYSLVEAYKRAMSYLDSGEYIDVHCHVFTCESFVNIMIDISESGFIDYQIVGVDEVAEPSNEFLIVMRKGSEDSGVKSSLE